MAKFPSNYGSTPMSLAKSLDQAMAVAGQIKVQAQTMRDQSAAGPVSATAIVQLSGVLASLRTQMSEVAATPGLSAYAQTQFPLLDVSASYSSMVSQLDATLSWIQSNFPKAASGELLERKFSADGRTSAVMFTSAALSAFRSQLDLLIAQID